MKSVFGADGVGMNVIKAPNAGRESQDEISSDGSTSLLPLEQAALGPWLDLGSCELGLFGLRVNGPCSADGGLQVPSSGAWGINARRRTKAMKLRSQCNRPVVFRANRNRLQSLIGAIGSK